MAEDVDLRAISYGAGVQSTAVLVMSNRGKCAKADVAIFADTQSEPPWVYETLKRMRRWSEIPVVTATAGSLMKDVVRRHRDGGRFAALPAFTLGADGRPTILRRQCTREYKIDVIAKELKRRLGLRPGQWAKGRVRAATMLGISLDEIQRAAPSRIEWIESEFPLLDAKLRRSDCRRIIADAGLPVPLKSSCTICPFHSDRYWLRLRNQHPEQWEEACAFDEKIRDMSMSGVLNPVFLHRSLAPLAEAPLAGDGQLSLWSAECTGSCGV